MRKLIDDLLSNWFKGRKIKILKEFDKKQYKVNELNKLAKKLGMSMGLLCYHINGNQQSFGLKDANCLKVEKVDGLRTVKITDNGVIVLGKYGGLK